MTLAAAITAYRVYEDICAHFHFYECPANPTLAEYEACKQAWLDKVIELGGTI